VRVTGLGSLRRVSASRLPDNACSRCPEFRASCRAGKCKNSQAPCQARGDGASIGVNRRLGCERRTRHRPLR
jgi:hypothetical protein